MIDFDERGGFALTLEQVTALEALLRLPEEERKKVATWIRFTTSKEAKKALLDLLEAFLLES